MLARQQNLLQRVARPLCALQQPKLQTLQNRRAATAFSPADLPEVKKKWEASERILRICRTMKNVAAGGFPISQRQLSEARPFGIVTLPLLEVEEEPTGVQKILHLPIGTERGLCGSVSSNTVLLSIFSKWRGGHFLFLVASLLPVRGIASLSPLLHPPDMHQNQTERPAEQL